MNKESKITLVGINPSSHLATDNGNRDESLYYPKTCWIWNGCKNSEGYGRFRLKNKEYYIHRISYEFFKKKIPKGLEIDHLCKNRDCLNPDHLEAVTHKENIARGNWISVINSRKTHCKRNHLLPTKKDNRNQRVCKICKNLRNKNYRRRKNESI